MGGGQDSGVTGTMEEPCVRSRETAAVTRWPRRPAFWLGAVSLLLFGALCAWRLALSWRPVVFQRGLWIEHPFLWATLFVALSIAWWVFDQPKSRLPSGKGMAFRLLCRRFFCVVGVPLLLGLLFWHTSRIELTRWEDRVLLKNLCLLPYMYADDHNGRFPSEFYQLVEPDERGSSCFTPDACLALYSRRKVTLESVRRGEFDYVYCGEGIDVPRTEVTLSKGVTTPLPIAGEIVVMHTKPGVAGNYVSVVFLDFHVNGIMVSELDSVLERSRRARARAGMALDSVPARSSTGH